MSEDLIRKIADTLEIQRLKALYCVTADSVTHDPAGAKELLQSMFTPDVRADYGAAICEGRDALVNYLVSVISEMEEWLLHGLQTPLIEIDGDKASGQWVIMVQNKQKHLSGKEMLVGRYIDEFVRTAEGWKISAVRFAEEGIYPQIDVTSPINPEPAIFR